MDPGNSNGPVATRAATNTTCGDGTASTHEIASEAYARGFAAGWADRAEYERRRPDQDALSFDDVLRLGYELGRST